MQTEDNWNSCGLSEQMLGINKALFVAFMLLKKCKSLDIYFVKYNDLH